jgi:adenylate cyclase
MTDYLAVISRFAPEGVIGEMECVYSSWASAHADGFADAHIAALKRVVPTLALAIKAAALARMTATLMETYLGRDAARRVLSGRIMRGVADRIDAVIWFSDLRNFTRITDTAPEQIISLLNDYADVIVSAIHAKGGDVLKLIGDGILAIFTAADRAHACAAALSAAMAARSKVAALNERRAREGLPVTDMYLGLHAGEVFYGNIGSTERLDFHRARAGRQRDEPHRRDVPLGRATGAGVGGFRQCRLHAQPPYIGRPLRVARGRPAARAFHAR